MTRMLLAAFLAGRKVELWVENTSNACYLNFPTFFQVGLKHDE